MAKQLNIFVENKPGRFESVTEILSKININIWVFTIQDRGEFGLLKLLVDKPDAAYLALADKGYACALRDVLMISVQDKPGNLHKLAKVLLEHKINISETFGFVLTPIKQGFCCLEVEDQEKIKNLLQQEGFTVIEEYDFS